MQTFILRRLSQGVIVLLVLTFLIFLVMRLLPGDPVLLYYSQGDVVNFTPQQLESIRAEYGLDKPVIAQYFQWVFNIFKGDLGKSIFYREQVSTLIFERMPVTIHLGLTAILSGAVIGIIFGIICALRRGKIIDTVLTFIANIGITAPGFWIGILVIFLFALQLHLLPTNGYTSPFSDFTRSTKQLIMPVFCLSFFSLASMTRQTRSSMLEVVRQDYVRTAWAKGLPERIIVTRHILKNGLIPVVTMFGMQVRTIFGGSVLIETVFNIPGFGRLLVQSVQAQDYQVVQGGVLVIGAIILLANLLVDISYGWLDPRIRYS
jgi:peptide/nickel transport system permease protein